MKNSLFRKIWNLWPPFLGAGIHVKKIAQDFTSMDVEMKLRPWNKSPNNAHYGGSIFSMTDPFFAMILIKNLGPDYIVWDKAAAIRFKKPGKGKLTAHFTIARQRIDEIRKQADMQDKAEPQFRIDIRDEAGNVVAEVDKTLYIRRRDKARHNKPKP
ncbi:MAG: DUF4442 domain-containing protein [Proteobacteria bacterium]|nr:DUF4442 domain-containing protein [Pseudomonadota bacterium]